MLSSPNMTLWVSTTRRFKVTPFTGGQEEEERDQPVLARLTPPTRRRCLTSLHSAFCFTIAVPVHLDRQRLDSRNRSKTVPRFKSKHI